MIYPPDQCTSAATAHSVINWAVIRVNGTICPNCTIGWSVDFGSMLGWNRVDADDALFLYRPYSEINPETGVIQISAEVYCDDVLLGQYSATLTLI